MPQVKEEGQRAPMEKEGLPVDEGPVKLKEEEGWPKVEEDNPLGDL